MPDRGLLHELRRFGGEYQRTWRATGPAGRGFLFAGLFYLIRAIAFTVAFPLYAKERGYSSGDIGLFLAASQFSLFLLGIPFTSLGVRAFARRVMSFAPRVASLGIAIILVTPGGAVAPMLIGAPCAGAEGAR